jgi:RNA polymerase sigma factor (TIGR02999 family)
MPAGRDNLSCISNRQAGWSLMERTHEITELLQAWSRGDPGALDKLTPLVHKELHKLAKRYMAGERPGHTLQTTALVNEAYLRLVCAADAGWESRAHFLAVSAQVMRRILVDWARSRQAMKRSVKLVPLEPGKHFTVGGPEPGPDLVALDDALRALAIEDPRKSKVVELRFFLGLSVEETAKVLKISSDTVTREWKSAKIWLRREMTRRRARGA